MIALIIPFSSLHSSKADIALFICQLNKKNMFDEIA